MNNVYIPMIKPLAVYIGLRYTRAKKKNQFVSFIALSSMLGIALGVAVLITVLSVMNGFDAEIKKRFFGMAPEITVTASQGAFGNWQKLEQAVAQLPGVMAVSPFVGMQGMLAVSGQVSPVIVTGVIPNQEAKVSNIASHMLAGDFLHIKPFQMILGQELADNLGVIVGDKITVMLPEATVTPAGAIPRFKRFTVGGVFSAGNGFNFDSRLAFVRLEDAQKLMHYGSKIGGLKLRLQDVYQAPALAQAMQEGLGADFQVGNWTEQLGAFFQAVKMEKTMMFFILLLIIAVAVFNLVSSLVMVVNDKQAEIAILRTIGATPGTILAIFIVQGMVIGIVGTLLGLIGGVILAHQAPDIVAWIQSVLGIQIFSSNVYFVDSLPSRILFSDLWQICSIALLMSFVATLYPAWSASKTIIAEALHYE